jgi:hypothetical protein
MGGDFEKEAAVVTSVHGLVAWGTTERNAAEHEGPGIVAELLPAGFSLLANEENGFELLEASLGDV